MKNEEIRSTKIYHAAGGGGGSTGHQTISEEGWDSLFDQGWEKVRRDLPDIGKSWAAEEYFVHPEDVEKFIAQHGGWLVPRERYAHHRG